MNVKDFRTGNVIEYFVDTDNLGWQTTTIDWQDLKRLEEQPLSFSKEHRYVRVTEELLLAFGFEFYKVLSHYRLIIDDVWYQIKINEKGEFIFSFTNLNYDETMYMPPKKIEFAHRLQNLMFELSNIELTLNNAV